MYTFIQEKPRLALGLVIAFSLLLRTTSLIPAILIFLFVCKLPDHMTSKKALKNLSIANVALTVLFVIFQRVYYFLVTMSYIYVTNLGLTITFSLLGIISMVVLIVMFVIYLVKEDSDFVNRLFALALILPVVGTIYYVADSFAFTLFYKILFDVNATSSLSSSAFNNGSSSLFTIAQIMILVYLLSKSYYKETKEIYEE